MLPVRLVVNWLKSQANPCFFAKSLAKEQGASTIHPLSFAPSPREDEIRDLFDAFLFQAAGASAAALFVFPTLRTDEEIADLLTSLARNARCKLIEYAWPPNSKRQEVLVGLEWETPAGLRSRAMGLAPSGHMPISRRAPVVSLLIWPGAHENIYRQTAYSTVGVADMKLGDITAETYAQWWEDTKAAKAARDKLEPSRSASFREVAFCLDERVRGRLTFTSAVPSAISEDQWRDSN